MRIAIILNGISSEKRRFYQKVLPALKNRFNVSVYETTAPRDAVVLASAAVQKKYDLIISAGGDGTLHQVVNGIMNGRENANDLPPVGVFPLGTGNDFARTLYGRFTEDSFVDKVAAARFKVVDVGTVDYNIHTGGSFENVSRAYFINVADIGMGPEVVTKVAKSEKRFGPATAYYSSILSTFATYKPMMVRMRSDAWELHQRIRTFAVANGKYYGHGLCIAPEATMDDGRFQVFACGNVSVLDFIIQSIPLKQGRRVRHKKVSYLDCTSVELTSDEPCMIEGDGEVLGWLPARISILPGKLKLLF